MRRSCDRCVGFAGRQVVGDQIPTTKPPTQRPLRRRRNRSMAPGIPPNGFRRYFLNTQRSPLPETAGRTRLKDLRITEPISIGRSIAQVVRRCSFRTYVAHVGHPVTAAQQLQIDIRMMTRRTRHCGGIMQVVTISELSGRSPCAGSGWCPRRSAAPCRLAPKSATQAGSPRRSRTRRRLHGIGGHAHRRVGSSQAFRHRRLLSHTAARRPSAGRRSVRLRRRAAATAVAISARRRTTVPRTRSPDGRTGCASRRRTPRSRGRCLRHPGRARRDLHRQPRRARRARSKNRRSAARDELPHTVRRRTAPAQSVSWRMPICLLGGAADTPGVSATWKRLRSGTGQGPNAWPNVRANSV